MSGPDSPPPTVAVAFARALQAAGVRRVYGLPGEDHLRLLHAFAEVDLTYVGARDEGAAAVMAATEAQATGVPGVVLVTLAPGLSNTLNGIAHAWIDQVPLLVVSGQQPAERAALIVRQLLDNHRLVDGLTRWQATVGRRVHQTLARALEITLAPPQGPVFLELRDEVAAQPALDQPHPWPLLQTTSRTVRLEADRTPASWAAADQIRALLQRAERPALIIGGAGGPPGAATCAALGAAAEALRAPLFASPAALGARDTTDPWFAGTFLNGNFEHSLLGRADLLLTVDLDARDFFNAPWRYDAPVVALNRQPDTQRFAPVALQVLGDPAAALEALVSPGQSRWTARDVADYRPTVRAPFASPAETLTIPSALQLARQVLPPETLVAVDAGFGKPLTSYLWSAPAPNRYFTAHGLSTMGYALPAATALQLCAPTSPVVGFMGDGSLLMRASELTVAAQHRVAPISIVWVDGTLGQIEVKQHRQTLQPVGALLPDVSCARIADAFGGVGVDVATPAAFCAALDAGLARDVPTLIGARVDQSSRAAWYELIRG